MSEWMTDQADQYRRRSLDIPDPLKTRLVGYTALFAYCFTWVMVIALLTGHLI